MTVVSGVHPSRVVTTDPRDARKPASVFFAEMPWNGRSALDPAQLPALRFLEVVCGNGDRGDDDV